MIVFWKRACTLLATCFIVVLVGCGGSTRGTGGVAVEGRVSKSDGAPESGVEVTILETGDSTSTDEMGSYSLRSAELPEYNLLLERGGFSAQVRLADIPSETTRVVADIEINTEQNAAKATSVKTEKKNKDKDKDKDTSSQSESQSSSSNQDQEDGQDQDESNDSFDDSDEDLESSLDDSSHDDSEDILEEEEEEDESSNSGSGSSSSSADDESEEEDSEEGVGCEEQDVEGLIESLTAEAITVEGVVFRITSETEFDDESIETVNDLSVGERVRVKGKCVAEELVADEIRIEEDE